MFKLLPALSVFASQSDDLRSNISYGERDSRWHECNGDSYLDASVMMTETAAVITTEVSSFDNDTKKRNGGAAYERIQS